MRIPRIYQAGNYTAYETLELSAGAFQHLIKVLRLSLSDKIMVFNGTGSCFNAEISRLHKKSCSVILTDAKYSSAPELQITLLQSVIKSDKMDLIIQKSVELGVTQIVPLITEHSQLKQSSTVFNKKHQHWQNIIISACEQSGVDYVPKLHEITLLKNIPADISSSLSIILDPDAEKSFNAISDKSKTINLFIGPEGGFTPDELSFVEKQLHCIRVRLGNRILRAETAAISSLSLCQWLLGDF